MNKQLELMRAYKKKSKDIPFKFKAIEDTKDGNRYVVGYASTSNIDWSGDMITDAALQDAQKDLLLPGTNTVFFNHDTDKPIGKVVESACDSGGLKIKVLISKAEDCDNIWTKIKEKILSNFSIRFFPKKITRVTDENGNTKYWEISKIRILEVSVVGLPCNSTANITEVIGKRYNESNNDKKRKTSMKTSSKKTTETEAKEPVVMDEASVKKLIDEASAKNVDVMVAKLKELGVIADKPVEKVTEKTEEKAKTDKTSETSKTSEDKAPAAKSVGSLTIEEFAAIMKSAVSASQTEEAKRKGIVDGESDTEEEAKPSKAELKKAMATMDFSKVKSFVDKAMNDGDFYAELDDAEKKLAKDCYKASAFLVE